MDRAIWCAVGLVAVTWNGGAASALERGFTLAQTTYRPFDSRPLRGPPTPAPRTFSGDQVVLPRVPYDNRYETLGSGGERRPGRSPRRGPESQRVVPGAPGAGGDPALFFDKPAANSMGCEYLRRLAVRTGRLYWSNRYQRCIGVNGLSDKYR